MCGQGRTHLVRELYVLPTDAAGRGGWKASLHATPEPEAQRPETHGHEAQRPHQQRDGVSLEREIVVDADVCPGLGQCAHDAHEQLG